MGRLTAAVSPRALPSVNRDHWGIAIMQRNKEIILGADGYTTRGDNAPRDVFSLPSFARKIQKPVHPRQPEPSNSFMTT